MMTVIPSIHVIFLPFDAGNIKSIIIETIANANKMMLKKLKNDLNKRFQTLSAPFFVILFKPYSSLAASILSSS